ncbi:MAG TPA: OB-fold nucleic acid binding domain-containing protein [Clostridiales bacterium]|nr:OB-fold nucleic acid binding domain-containing protein [Clostridiales bacterium]
MTVNQLETNARFVGFLLVRSADARTDKKGGSYLDLTLADKTGDINCKYWDWNELMDVPKQGSVIKVQGLVQEYNGRKQLRIERMRAALPQDEVDMAQLVACAPEKPEVMRKDIEDTIDTFQSEALKKIVREMLRLTGDKLEWFPAAQRLHHAERSGLLHHTTSMLNLARHVVAAYPFLNAELLYAGVILHDLCKTTEMISDETGSVSDYSADGLLIGHLVRGVARIEEAAKNVGVSGEIVLLLEHMVLSHHSIPEYGSPKAPMFPEAEVLARIDDLDAKMNEMQGILSRVPEGAFSEKVWSLDRRIYHPKYQEIDGAE